jgi:hypothetical protein
MVQAPAIWIKDPIGIFAEGAGPAAPCASKGASSLPDAVVQSFGLILE